MPYRVSNSHRTNKQIACRGKKTGNIWGSKTTTTPANVTDTRLEDVLESMATPIILRISLKKQTSNEVTAEAANAIAGGLSKVDAKAIVKEDGNQAIKKDLEEATSNIVRFGMRCLQEQKQCDGER